METAVYSTMRGDAWSVETAVYRTVMGAPTDASSVEMAVCPSVRSVLTEACCVETAVYLTVRGTLTDSVETAVYLTVRGTSTDCVETAVYLTVRGTSAAVWCGEMVLGTVEGAVKDVQSERAASGWNGGWIAEMNVTMAENWTVVGPLAGVDMDAVDMVEFHLFVSRTEEVQWEDVRAFGPPWIVEMEMAGARVSWPWTVEMNAVRTTDPWTVVE